MKKLKICSIKNWNNKSCYKLVKSETYYEFLFGLLNLNNIRIPDIYDYQGEKQDIFEEKNTCTVYANKEIEIIEITSEDNIFLIIEPNNDRSKKYFMDNCDFIKNDNS